MLLPSNLLVKKLEELRLESIRRRRKFAAEAYKEAIAIAPGLFRNRGFGEAVPVAAKEFQLRASKATNEEAKMAWLRCVDELAQLVNDLN